MENARLGDAFQPTTLFGAILAVLSHFAFWIVNINNWRFLLPTAALVLMPLLGDAALSNSIGFMEELKLDDSFSEVPSNLKISDLIAWQVLFSALGGSAWTACNSESVKNDPCESECSGAHIQCQTIDGELRITKLNLANMNLHGFVVESALQALSSLSYIDFSGPSNHLSNPDCIRIQKCYSPGFTCLFHGTGVDLCPRTTTSSFSGSTLRRILSSSSVPTTSRPATLNPTTPTISPTFPTNPQDLIAWQAFYTSLHGSQWSSCGGQVMYHNPCTNCSNGSALVVCAPINGESRLSIISLDNNNLKGWIPDDALSTMSYLGYLDLSNSATESDNVFENTKCLNLPRCYAGTAVCDFQSTGMTVCAPSTHGPTNRPSRSPTTQIPTATRNSSLEPTAPTLLPTASPQSLYFSDLDAWQALFDALNATAWVECGTTSARTDPCAGDCSGTTQHVTCGEVNGIIRITQIVLPNNNLHGWIPESALQVLDALTDFDVHTSSGSSTPNIFLNDVCINAPVCILQNVVCDVSGSGASLCASAPPTFLPTTKPTSKSPTQSPHPEPSSGDLLAWQAFFDAMNGTNWAYCANTRNAPCNSCNEFSDLFVHCEKESSVLRIVEIIMTNNNIRGVIPKDSMALMTNLTLFDISNIPNTSDTTISGNYVQPSNPNAHCDYLPFCYRPGISCDISRTGTTLCPSVTPAPTIAVPTASPVIPTSLSPTTKSPKTKSPSTEKPTTLNPSASLITGKPTTLSPATEKPTIFSLLTPSTSPTTNKPTISGPSTSPVTEKPSIFTPSASPITEIPSTNKSSTSTSPVTEKPSILTPSTSPVVVTKMPSISNSTSSPVISNSTTKVPSTLSPSTSPIAEIPSTSPATMTPRNSNSTSSPAISNSTSNPVITNSTTRVPSTLSPSTSPVAKIPSSSPATMTPSNSNSTSSPVISNSTTKVPSTLSPSTNLVTPTSNSSLIPSVPSLSSSTGIPSKSPSTFLPTGSPTVQLAPSDMQAWIDMYDDLNGPHWVKCNNERDNACGCSLVKCEILSLIASGRRRELATQDYRITEIHMSNNNLSGIIPPAVANLTAIKVLVLSNTASNPNEENRISGGCSYFSQICKQGVTVCSFYGTPMSGCSTEVTLAPTPPIPTDSPTPAQTPEPPTESPTLVILKTTSPTQSSTILLVEIIVPIIVFLILLILCCCYFCRRKKKAADPEKPKSEPKKPKPVDLIPASQPQTDNGNLAAPNSQGAVGVTALATPGLELDPGHAIVGSRFSMRKNEDSEDLETNETLKKAKLDAKKVDEVALEGVDNLADLLDGLQLSDHLLAIQAQGMTYQDLVTKDSAAKNETLRAAGLKMGDRIKILHVIDLKKAGTGAKRKQAEFWT